jgi:hypothetical protein
MIDADPDGRRARAPPAHKGVLRPGRQAAGLKPRSHDQEPSQASPADQRGPGRCSSTPGRAVDGLKPSRRAGAPAQSGAGVRAGTPDRCVDDVRLDASAGAAFKSNPSRREIFRTTVNPWSHPGDVRMRVPANPRSRWLDEDRFEGRHPPSLGRCSKPLSDFEVLREGVGDAPDHDALRREGVQTETLRAPRLEPSNGIDIPSLSRDKTSIDLPGVSRSRIRRPHTQGEAPRRLGAGPPLPRPCDEHAPQISWDSVSRWRTVRPDRTPHSWTGPDR